MDEDLKQLAPVVEALRAVACNPDTYGKTLDEVDQQFAEALREMLAEQSAWKVAGLSPVNRFKRSIVRALHKPKSHEELLASIKRACDLSDRQARLLVDVRLLAIDVEGQPVLRIKENVILSPAKAATYLFLIGCLTGIAISSVLVEPEAGLALVIRGFGLGLAIGSVAGFVLGRSFRAYPIIEKIEALYPWLNACQPSIKAG